MWLLLLLHLSVWTLEFDLHYFVIRSFLFKLPCTFIIITPWFYLHGSGCTFLKVGTYFPWRNSQSWTCNFMKRFFYVACAPFKLIWNSDQGFAQSHNFNYFPLNALHHFKVWLNQWPRKIHITWMNNHTNLGTRLVQRLWTIYMYLGFLHVIQNHIHIE